jgi:undecaprenyl-diphosphatase
LTSFFKSVTVLGNTASQVVGIALFAGYFFFRKNWRAEAGFVLVSGVLGGLLILLLKKLYARPRPSIEWLIEEHGFSFPSGHTTGAILIFGALLIIASQRMDKGLFKSLVRGFLITLIVTIALSRIYLGVHYPTDILGGWLLGLAVLNLIYPIYMDFRFKLRFKGLSK